MSSVSVGGMASSVPGMHEAIQSYVPHPWSFKAIVVWMTIAVPIAVFSTQSAAQSDEALYGRGSGMLWTPAICPVDSSGGYPLRALQFSVTEHFRPSEQGHSLPGVFFFYDLSPIKVRLGQSASYPTTGRQLRCAQCSLPWSAFVWTCLFSLGASLHGGL